MWGADESEDEIGTGSVRMSEGFLDLGGVSYR